MTRIRLPFSIGFLKTGFPSLDVREVVLHHEGYRSVFDLSNH